MIKCYILDKNEPEPTYDEIRLLVRDLYSFMETKGLSLLLADRGESLLVNSMKKLLNTINFISVVKKNKEVIGFAHANVKILPDYLGGEKAGFISHLYIKPYFREQGLADKLIDLVVEGLKNAKVQMIELDVLIQNENAIRFYERKGFSSELIRMRKNIESNEYL